MGSSNQTSFAQPCTGRARPSRARLVAHCCAAILVGMIVTLNPVTSVFAQSYASFGDQSSPAAPQQSRQAVVKHRTQGNLATPPVNTRIAPPTPIAQPNVSRAPGAVATVSYQQVLPTLNGPSTLQTNRKLLYEDYIGEETPMSLHPTPDAVRRLRNSYSRDLPVARFAKSELASNRLPAVGRQEDPFGEQQKPPVAKPRSIQPQPTTLQPPVSIPNASDIAPGSFEPPSNVFSPNRVTPRSTTPRQEDPFGENQKQPNTNTPPPRQEDPFGENQKPPVGNTDPRTPVTQPRTTPRGQLPNVQPPVDPPTRDPVMQDPQLPNDAQGGTIRPTSPREVIRPNVPSNPREPRETDSPPPQGIEQGAPDFEGGRARIDDSISYDQGEPLPEREPLVIDANRPSDVYRPPSEVPLTYPTQVPISQPLYEPGYEIYNPPTQGRGQSYVPAFDPIPGLIQPQTNQRQPGMPYYGSSQPSNPMGHRADGMQPGYGQPVVVNETYSPVVTGQPTCQPCQTGYDACGEPIYPKPGFLRSLLMDDSQITACEPTCHAFYFAFQGGWSDLQNMIDGEGTELETESGSVFAFALGRINGRNLRTEVELSFRNNEISDRTSFGASTATSGDISSFSGMGNLYWEFVDFPGGRFRPYVGFGVGFASLEANLNDQFGSSILASEGGSDTSFAYQWMAGMNYRANPNMDLFVEYRFFEADSIVLTSTGNISDKFNYQTNNVGIGLRWKF